MIDIDLRAGQQRLPEFLALNPFGQVPVINDNGVVIADSNAILVYLALKYGASHWLPRDAIGAAAVQRWLSVAAGEIAYGPAAARLGKQFGVPVDAKDVVRRTSRLFAVMEQELLARPFLVGEQVTIADISCYSYIARAPEGDISLHPYPAICAWLARVEALPRFLSMIKLQSADAKAA